MQRSFIPMLFVTPLALGLATGCTKGENDGDLGACGRVGAPATWADAARDATPR